MAEDSGKKEDSGKGEDVSKKQDSGGGELQSLKDQIASLMKEKEDWGKKELSLNDKVKIENDDRVKKDSDTRKLESALTFNLTSAEFIKINESILPKDISDIFKAADREKYESAIDKANATKAAIIQSFFSQESNVEFLTPSQKSALADYLKLTKNGKEDKAREIYENLFEPSLATLKRVKKAEELYKSKNGFRGDSQGDSQYKEKLMALSKKHFLGEKV